MTIQRLSYETHKHNLPCFCLFEETYVSSMGLATADKLPYISQWILIKLLPADKFPQAHQLAL